MKKRLTVKNSFQLKSRMKILLFCLISLFVCHAEQLKVIYSTGNNGSLEFCGCPHDRNSGLSGRISKLLQIADSNTMVIEAGNLFAINQSESDLPVLYDLLSLKQPDFIALGINDLPYITSLSDKKNKLLGYNLEKCLKSTIVDKSGIKIGLISAVDPDYSSRYGNIVQALDFTKLKSDIVDLRRKCDLLIVLSSLSENQESELFGSCKSIDILVSANRSDRVSDKFGNRYFTALGRRNSLLGEFTVDVQSSKLLGHRFLSVDPDSVQITSEIQKIVLDYNLKKLNK